MARGAVQRRSSRPTWRPLPEWAGLPAVVVGTGPSFDCAQTLQIREARSRGVIRVIAVNDAVRRLPCADIVFAADRKWWRARDHIPGFAGRRVGLADSYFDAPENVLLLRRSGCEGCETTPGLVHTHGHSGAMAVQLAAQLGAAPIVLVGFDMRHGKDGTRHYFGEYEKPLGSQPDMAVWLSRFREIAKVFSGRILNASPGSAIDFVPRVDLAEFLRQS